MPYSVMNLQRFSDTFETLKTLQHNRSVSLTASPQHTMRINRPASKEWSLRMMTVDQCVSKNFSRGGLSEYFAGEGFNLHFRCINGLAKNLGYFA